jgi:transposase
LSYLVGAHGVSKRGLEEITEAIFDAPVCRRHRVGTVSNLEQEMSAALEAPHAQAVAAVRQAAVKHVDETGWKQAGQKRWLWVAATTNAVVFLIHRLRSPAPLLRLLGRTLVGILCSDRWHAYTVYPLAQRQICWAHVKRNFEKLAEGGGVAKEIGTAALEVQRQVFEEWHLYRGGGCTREQLMERIEPLEVALVRILSRGAHGPDEKTARFCTRLYKVQEALWTFARVEGVEPTNNHGERVQRVAVLWRRRSFGCQSAEGCRFVERILTVVQTLRLQQRSVLEYLTATLTAHRSGQPVPQLVQMG